MGLTFSVTNAHHFKGGEKGRADAGVQEADSDHAEICEGAIESPWSSNWRERIKQIEKVSNQHSVLASCHVAFAYL